MKNFFKILLLLVILFVGFLVFRSFQNNANLEEHKEIIESSEPLDNDTKSNKIEEKKIDEEKDKIKKEGKVEKNKTEESKVESDKNKSIDKKEKEKEKSSILEKSPLDHKESISVLRKNDVYIGNKNAGVVMIEYDSLTCPHCKDFAENIFPQIKKDYIDTGKLLYITRPFPTDGISFKLALMVECLDKSEDKMKLRSIIFKNQNLIEKEFKGINFNDKSDENMKRIENAAKSFINSMVDNFTVVGFDGTYLKQCGDPESKNPKTQDIVKKLLDDSKEVYESVYKIEATPSFLINGKKYDGTQNIKYWKDVIEKEINSITNTNDKTHNIETTIVTQNNGGSNKNIDNHDIHDDRNHIKSDVDKVLKDNANKNLTIDIVNNVDQNSSESSSLKDKSEENKKTEVTEKNDKVDHIHNPNVFIDENKEDTVKSEEKIKVEEKHENKDVDSEFFAINKKDEKAQGFEHSVDGIKKSAEEIIKKEEEIIKNQQE